MILHGYWRSSAAYRVRIALALKGLAVDQATHDLRTGAQRDAGYRAVNPQALVPALDTGDDGVLTQSGAIVEWLEERYPDPPLLPAAPGDRARVRALAQIVGCDIHPLNNLRVLQALRAAGVEEGAWIARWIGDGFDAIEPMIVAHGRGYAWGDAPTIADCFLVPQAYNAERFGIALTRWPALAAAVDRARAHPAFAAAHPDRQPDAG